MLKGSLRGGSASPIYRCAPSILVLFGVPALPVALRAQEAEPLRADMVSEAAGRIWGRVETVSGRTYEGFIRWDRNEGSWVDVLDGTKDRIPEGYLVWNDRTGTAEPVPERIVDYGGYRISFPDHLSTSPSTAESGIRFGHIRRLEVRDARGATVELKSGRVLDLWGGGTDLGRSLREIVVEEPGGRSVDLTWEDLVALELATAPPGAAPSGRRLHGTVRDRFGHEHTGFIAWNAEKILDTDRLEGREGTATRQIPFGRISSLERTGSGASVVLADGGSVQLVGPGDIGRGSQRILISDPGLGSVEVRWRDVESVLFHRPSLTPAYGDFDGGRPLTGTVVTREGAELSGLIRWDADEEYTWELLDGNRDGAAFDVELGEVITIERLLGETVKVGVGVGVSVDRERREGVRVVLRDGRVLELSGSNDVSQDNKGIWVRVEPVEEARTTPAAPEESSATAEAGPDPLWVSVRWEDFRTLRLHH
jgi:hypothetical protein